MASSSQRVSASLPSTEPSAPPWKYDVFLSFRGEDVRKTFLSHLYHELETRRILTFKDDKELEVGTPISPSLLKAIEESRFAIIVLSPNYASSPWCLKELTKIVDCMEDKNRILPFFYHVEPSDVRHQKRSFEVAFIGHEEKSRHEIETLRKWRDTLKTVANFSGWHTKNYKTERELVEDIVEFVCNKVGRQVVYLADYKSSHQNLALRCGRKEFSDVLPQEVVFLNLTTLSVHNCGWLRFLLSFSMAKSLVELKHLKVSTCEIMEEIVSTRDQSNEETIDSMFCKLKSLTLDELPKLARFCTERYIKFSPEKKFDTVLGESICDPRSSRKLDIQGEIEVQNCIFDAQVKFPSLEKLKIKGLRKLQTIWNNQLADQDSFCRLREVDVSHCNNLMIMFVPIMMGRLNALETLDIDNCESLEVTFEIGGTDVEERHADTSSPHQLGPFYCQSLGSVHIYNCDSLQNIFPTSVARGLQKLYELTVEYCDEVEEIIFGEEGLETTPPQFVFPKVTSVTFDLMPKLSRFLSRDAYFQVAVTQTYDYP